jgi:ACS family tartrate transporter-like MFS transporter
MFTWGVVSVLTIFVKSPFQFCAARLVLGIAEAGFFPGAIYYLARWYPSFQRSSTISRFYLAYPLSSSIMGAVAGYLITLDGRAGISGWQWLLIAEGLPAILLSFALLLFLPDAPASADWLTIDEKESVLRALADETVTPDSDKELVRRVLLDPSVWVLAGALFLLYLGIYGYTFNAPELVERSTGLGSVGVGWTMAGLGVAAAFSMWLNGRYADRKRKWRAHVVVPALVMALGFIAAGASDKAWMVIPGLLLIFAGYNALQGPFWALPPLIVRRSSLAEGIAAVNMIAIFGGFCGPFWMGVMKDVFGNYQLGLLSLAVPSAAAGLILLAATRPLSSKHPVQAGQ